MNKKLQHLKNAIIDMSDQELNESEGLFCAIATPSKNDMAEVNISFTGDCGPIIEAIGREMINNPNLLIIITEAMSVYQGYKKAKPISRKDIN